MSWNYRVVKEKTTSKEMSEAYRICEVYYTKKGKINGWCRAQPFGETPEELEKSLKLMLKAFKKPVLVEKKNEKLVLYKPKKKKKK